MKHFVYAVSGAVLFSMIGFPVSSGLSHVYEMKFATSQNSMDSVAVVLILVVIPAFAIAGGLLGRGLYRKNLTSGHSERLKEGC